MSRNVGQVPVFDSRITVPPTLLTARTRCAPPEADPQAPVNRIPLVTACVVGIVLLCHVWLSYGAQHGVYLLLGTALGVTLFHSRFGFASGFQQLLSVGNGQGLRAHALLLAVAASVVMLAAGLGIGLFGSQPTAEAQPIGLALVLGAVCFGTGMQLAGSCAAGTLFASGSGHVIVLLTLFAFVSGGTAASWADPVVGQMPRLEGVLLSDHVGWFGAWLITVAVVVLVVVVTRIVQWRRNPPPVAPVASATGFARLYRGAWPMLTGAVVLGLLAGAVFLVSGQTWDLTEAFPLWGAKTLQAFGLHPETWPFWTDASKADSLARPLLADRTSLTNFGIMIGAAIAIAAAGAWEFTQRVPWRLVLAALCGGALMGIGAQLTAGCNIGAYLGGVSVGSLHGWLWGVLALAGTWLGLRLRPLFGLHNPKPQDGIC